MAINLNGHEGQSQVRCKMGREFPGPVERDWTASEKQGHVIMYWPYRAGTKHTDPPRSSIALYDYSAHFSYEEQLRLAYRVYFHIETGT